MVAVRPTLRQQKRRLVKKLAEKERMHNLANAMHGMDFVMRMWLAPDGDKQLVQRCGMDASHMMHIGMGQQNREAAVETLKSTVARFVAAHPDQVEAEGGSDIEQGVPQWNYVHYAEMRKKRRQQEAGGTDYPSLYLLLEYIPWAEEASIFVYMLTESQIASLPVLLKKQGCPPSASFCIEV